MTTKKVWITSLGAIAIATYAWVGGDSLVVDAGTIREDTLFTVRRGDLVINLVENGTLVAKDSEKLTPKMRGQCKILSIIPEGDAVEEGQVICKFDDTALIKSLEETELALLTAETQLSTAKTNLELQKMDNSSKTEKAKVALNKARMELERYRDGDGPQQLRKLDIARREAEYQLEKAKKRYADSQILIKQKFIEPTELQEHQIQFNKAKVEHESATLAIKLFEKYEYPITLATKTSELTEAERALSAEQKRGESQHLQKRVAVTQAEKRVKKVKKSIAKLKEDIEQLTIKAPCPGVVIYGDPRNPFFRQNIKIGGVVWQGQTLMTIPDLRVMMVKLEIHEADINKLASGQRATISMDTYPGTILSGKVVKVAQLANSNSPWSQPSAVKKFKVELLIEDSDGLHLKPGISAKAEILIDKIPNALFVPIQCVFLEGEHHLCHVAVDGVATRRRIKIGKSNSTHTEVLDGLHEGEKVLLYNPDLGRESGRRSDDGGEDQGSGEVDEKDSATSTGKSMATGQK